MSIITPPELVEGMSYDEFCDWAEQGKKQYIEDAIVEFRKYGLLEHVQIMKIILQRNYYQSLDI
jgi:hypothetical protein